jgi:CRISPR-associated endonuclease/helicase Cas3
MSQETFSIWFKDTKTNSPFPYQQVLAESDYLPDILNVMTGAGKTLAIIMAWLWRSLYHSNLEVRKTTPRKLVIVLPMRTLVEQTFAVAEKCLEKAAVRREIELHMLMGGAIDSDWEMHPERRAILIGTQDQLLSRGLNRGYAMSPFRWPIHYGLLNNDCLWVFDEVQLMGVALKTSTQLQGFREKFGTYGTTQSLWMSATIKPAQLQTIDFRDRELRTLELSDADRTHPVLQQRIQAKKALSKATTIFGGKEPEYAKKLAKEVHESHQAGKLTLVVVNKVSRARAVYKELQKLVGNEFPILLIHSRFRSADRKKLTDKLLDRENPLTGFLITTQAVEAGVDISASTLFTELAPWSSIVQRAGRCNRYGENDLATVFWIDIDLTKKNTNRPYEEEDLKKCKEELEKLTDVGAAAIEAVKVSPPNIPGNLLRLTDLLQLFDTSEDLAGHAIDVSSFIRDTSETDIGIAWREWKEVSNKLPPDTDMVKIESNEICRASLYSKEAKDFLDNLKKNKDLWVRNDRSGEWENPENLHSGMTVLVHCDRGGYSQELGFTGDPRDRPSPTPLRLNEKEDSDRADWWTQAGEYITITQHAEDVAKEVTKICQELSGWELPTQVLIDSGRWHDQGKAHGAFQDMLTQNRSDKQNGELWAKSDNLRGRMTEERRGFRHELVSALCALETGQSFLLAYLVAAHHGKVRMQIQPRPNERPPADKDLRYALGVRDRDLIPAVDLGAGVNTPEIEIDLSCMELGGGESGKPSWAQQAAELLEEYGPFKLALLESIIRIADIRVSQDYQKQQEQKND